jgi:hypothetical protein
LISFLSLISIPFVQTYLGKKVTNSINKKYDTNINVGKISLNVFFGNIVLKDIYIADHHQDTLASIGSLSTSILDLKKINEGDLFFDVINIDQLDLLIKTYSNEKDTSLDVFIDSFSDKKNLNNLTVSTFLLNSRIVEIENSRFRFINENLETKKILDFKELNVLGKDLSIDGPNVNVSVLDSKMKDHRGLVIKSLKTKFFYSLTKMNFENIILNTDNSSVLGNLVFNYKRSDFSDFSNKVKLKAKFKNSKIAYNDLNFFTDIFGTGKFTFNTDIVGTFNDLKMSNLNLQTLNRTKVKSDLIFKNLLSKTKPFKLDANINSLESTYTDLKNILPKILGENLPSLLRNIGVFKTAGKFLVTKDKVDIDATLNTAIGVVTPKIVFSNLNLSNQVSYEGSVNFEKFNFGKLLDEKNIGESTLLIDFKGVGFDSKNINSSLNAQIGSFNFNKYIYRNVYFRSSLNDQILKCSLKSSDKNFKAVMLGEINMKSSTNKYNFNSSINFADLNKLNLVKRDSVSIFKGDISLKSIGTSIDNLNGELNLNNSYYTNENKIFKIDDLKIVSHFDDLKNRTITFNSLNYISGELYGNFKFKELITLAKNDLGIIYTNYTPLKVSKNQFFDFNLKITDNFLQIFYPRLKVNKNLIANGRVSSNEEDFKMNLKSSKMNYNNTDFENVDFKLDNANPFYNAFVKISKIKTNFYDISNFNLVNKTISDTLFFRTEFNGGKTQSDEFKLNLYLADDAGDKTVLGFKKSDLKINNYDWFINEFNNKNSKLVFDKNFSEVILKEFKISHQDEYLKLYGAFKGENKKNINLNVNKVFLSKLLPEIKHFSFKGEANGNLIIDQDRYGYKPTANFELANFGINDINLGLFKLDIKGNETLNNYSINSSISNEGKKTLDADGYLDLTKKYPFLDLNLNLKSLDFSFFNGLADDVVSDIRGYVSGNAKLYGNYDNPDFKGKLTLDKAGLNIPYLNIDFNIDNDSEVLLSNKQFIFNNINLTDTKYNSSGSLNGFASHNYFTDWMLGLEISSENLLVLNTAQDENSLYYGKAFISGTAEIIGETNNLLVKVNAKTNEGTVFKIPISDSESVGDNSFIKTVSKYDRYSKNEISANLPTELNGLELEFDLDVTPDAEIEIVLDQEAGSVLKGRGVGEMRIEINTNDKFNMYGDFDVTQGTYNFVYGNNFLQGGFIEKRFKVKPGGTINWDGSPFKAQLNMDAVYSTSANPALLLDNPSINRKIPVDVIINLNGGLMQPDVNFNIEFPKTNSVVKSELLYKLDDKEFRDKQALSLVTTGQFTGSYAYGQGAVTGNLVERATSLLNNMLNNADDKFKIGLNYEQGENNPLEEQRIEDRLGFTISTQISDKILINGKVGIPVGGVSKTVVAGDVQMEILLNGDGTLRAKIFNRENDLSQITTTTNELGYTQGLGISYKVEFDNFEELIQKILKGKKKVAVRKQKELEKTNSFIKTQPKKIN